MLDISVKYSWANMEVGARHVWESDILLNIPVGLNYGSKIDYYIMFVR